MFPRIFLLLLLVCPLRAEVPTNGWTLVWNDEFDGTKLDTAKWGYWLTGTRRNAVNTPTAVSVGGGAVTIATYTSGGTHYTGMISTSGTYLPAYGYIEARINFGETAGMWSAFWMQSPTMGNPIGDAETAGTEIDICEHRFVDGSATNIDSKIVGNIHWDGYGASHKSVGYDSGNLSLGSGYHVYGMEWTTTTQRFYIDGVLKWTVNDATASPVAQRSEFIILSSEVDDTSTTWAGTIPAAGYGSLLTTTTKMVVDYVRVYHRAETAVNGDFEARLAPFGAFNQGSWSATGGNAVTGAGKIAPTSGSGASVEQTIRGLLPDTDYVLTAWGNAGTVSPSLFFGAKNYGGAQVGQTITSSTFTKATVPFTTGATNRSAAAFAFAGTSGTVAYADDFLLRRAEKVNNGSLESGEAGAWTSMYGGTSVSRDGTNFDGSYALKIPASTSSAGAEQEIVGLAPGTAYRLSGWTTNGGLGLTLGVKNHGGSQVQTNVAASAWTRGTVDFTTGAANTTATVFAFRGSSTTISYADSFFLYQSLAAPWAAQDVTDIPLDGIAGRLGDRFVIQAAGADIWSASDKFHFVNQTMTGDGQITARILGLDNTNIAAKTGVMMRETLGSGAKSVMVNWTPGQKVEVIRRVATSSSSSADTATDVTNPPWVRLARRGNIFNGYYSTDGVTWTAVGPPLTIAMASTIYVGLPACSHDDALLTEAVLDNVTLAVPPPDVAITSAVDGVTLGLGARLRLTATLTDIGTQGTPFVVWSQVSGPASVAFPTNGSTDASAAFFASGKYVLQCAAITGAGTGSARITVNVIASPDATRVLALKLNESAGTTAADSSGSGNNGTVNGGVTWQPAGGQLLGAAVFNGTDSYLNIPDAASLDGTSAFTLTYWFKVNTINGAGLVSKRTNITDNNAYTTFLQTDARLNVDIDTNNDRFTSNTAFATGAWYHVAVVFDGTLAAASRARLYVNGVLDVVANETSASVPNYTSSLKVGISHVGTTAFLDGLVDDVRFYRRALPATEVAAIAEGNFAPTISAGTAPSIINGIAASLGGSATNELSGTLTTTWSKVNGPGTATFGDATNPATTVTFNQRGAYVLRLMATNSVAQDLVEIAINVAANPNIFADWQSLMWPSVTDTNIIGPLADPDLDGVSNLLEHALGTNATLPSSAALPASMWRNVSGVDYLALQIRRPIGRIGVTYSAEVSGNLATWTAAAQDGAPVANGDGTETVIFRDTAPRGTDPRFIRLKITQP